MAVNDLDELKTEYVELAWKLDKLPPADRRGLPWVERREELRSIFKARGVKPPTRYEHPAGE